MISPGDRPFELLRLIRDGVITHVSQLRLGDRRSDYLIDAALSPLVDAGLITQSSSGELDAAPRLRRVFAALGVSLTRLSPYESTSVIASPAFGLPAAPSVKA